MRSYTLMMTALTSLFIPSVCMLAIVGNSENDDAVSISEQQPPDPVSVLGIRQYTPDAAAYLSEPNPSSLDRPTARLSASRLVLFVTRTESHYHPTIPVECTLNSTGLMLVECLQNSKGHVW